MLSLDEHDYFERQEVEAEVAERALRREQWERFGEKELTTTPGLRGKDPKLAKPAKPQMILYGEPGVGKTWFALQFPDAYLIDCEGGANLPHYTDVLKKSGALYFGLEDGAGDFDEVIKEVSQLATLQHDRQTLIIDGFTRLFDNVCQSELREMLKRKPDLDITKTYGAEKKRAIAKCKQLLSFVSMLDLNVLIICHSAPNFDDDADGNKADVHKSMTFDVNLILEASLVGPTRYARVRKSRYQQFEQGEQFEFNYKNFQSKWGKK